MEEPFSDRLRARRKQLKMTQQDVANAAGVSRAIINRLENNSVENVRESTIKDIVKVLGLAEPAKVTKPRLAIATSTVTPSSDSDLRERIRELEKELAREKAWTEKLWQENQQYREAGKPLASPDAADAPHIAPMWVAA